MDKIIFNNSCFFGFNSIREIPNEIRNRHLTKGFIITDNNLVEVGIYQKVADIISKSKIECTAFFDVNPEPTIKDVKNTYDAFKRSSADFILAIGGGSVLDTAKIVSIIAKNTKYADVFSLQGHKDNLNTPIPVFAVPTTAGSGSEVSKSVDITDEIQNKKIVCFSDKILPTETFIDPELMVSMPDIVTLSSGFDLISHAIESLLSTKSNMFSETLAKEALKIAIKNLPKVYDDPENLDAREKMAYAEYIAGLAYSNSGLGLAHSLAHAICGKVKMQHGVALAMVSSSVLKFNMFSPAAEKYKLLAEAFNIDTKNMQTSEICRLVVKEFEKFKNQFNIPKNLSDYGVKEEYLDIIAVNAFEDECSKTNPREATMTEIYMLLKKML